MVGVDVPVDAVAAAGLLAPHLEHEDGLDLGVGLVLLVVCVDLEAVPYELVGPVALLAGLAGGTEVVHRRGDRPRVEVEGHGHDLPGPRELGLDEPARPGADVAL
ncbi:MAG: hypothetical protein ACYS99_23835, partial [Planctomycetota bacterium]